jgi:hypothetical protein
VLFPEAAGLLGERLTAAGLLGERFTAAGLLREVDSRSGALVLSPGPPALGRVFASRPPAVARRADQAYPARLAELRVGEPATAGRAPVEVARAPETAHRDARAGHETPHTASTIDDPVPETGHLHPPMWTTQKLVTTTFAVAALASHRLFARNGQPHRFPTKE